MRKVVVVLLATAALTALTLTSASAQLDLVLESYTFLKSPGADFVISGTIRNLSPHSVTLVEGLCSSGDTVWAETGPFRDQYLSKQLAPNESWYGQLLWVRVASDARPGDVEENTYLVQSYCEQTQVTDTAERFFTVNVIPEPSSLLALACGLAGVGGMLLRRRRSR